MQQATKKAVDTRYASLEAAQKYQTKIQHKRSISRWLEDNMLVRALKSVEAESVLDCPCGTGRIDHILRTRFGHILGVDLAAPMLEVYQAANSNRQAMRASVFDLPFKDAEFDWTISHRLFHHFHDDATRLEFLNSVARVSRYGVVFYAWLNVPLSNRGRTVAGSVARGRQSISLAHLEDVVSSTKLQLEKVSWAAWPLSPKATITCSVRR